MSFAIALCDEQWELVADLFDPPGRRGAPAQIPRRQMVDAMLFIGRTGCQWRYLPERYGVWTAVWAQWRRWRANGVWARAMTRLAAIVRVLHDREPVPSMVMVDAQTVKGGRYGPTFHEAGGRGGRTIGTKRTLLVEILGLPVAASACSARPHDVVAARESCTSGSMSCRASGRSLGTAPIAASPGSPSANTSCSTSRRRRLASARSPHSGRSTRSSTPSPSWDAGAACRAATKAPRRAPGPGWSSPRSATSPGAPSSDQAPDAREARGDGPLHRRLHCGYRSAPLATCLVKLLAVPVAAVPPAGRPSTSHWKSATGP